MEVDTFVETGTWKAVTAIDMSSIFNEVHSIELSVELYKQAVEKCKHIENINLHYGDSAEVLPTLTFNVPVCYFLDAHACSVTPTAQGHFPLWKELDYILSRPYNDLLIIDDVHCFDQKKSSKPMSYWSGVNEKSLIDYVLKKKIISDFFVIHDALVIHLGEENANAS